MSKQPVQKSETTRRPTSSPRPAPPAATNTTNVRPAPPKRPAVVAKKQGFKLRPLDITLLLLGLLVVGVIVWSTLSGGNKDLTVLAPTGSSSKPDIKYLPVGSVAPDFSLPAPDGKTYSLSANKGKVVMVEFMAPWCPHCQEDAPLFGSLYDTYKSKGLEAMGVSATDKGRDHSSPIAMEDMSWFRDQFKVPYPLLYDPSLKTADDYLIEYFPTIYIIDKQGKVAAGLNDDPDNPLSYDKRIAAEIEKALK